MVNRRSTSTTPEPILQLQRQLEDFRSSQSGRVKLPDSLWQAAVELAWVIAQPRGVDVVLDTDRNTVKYAAALGRNIHVASGLKQTDKRMVDVQWLDRHVVMFAVDIQKRSEEVRQP